MIEKKIINAIDENLKNQGYSLSRFIESFLDNIEDAFERQLKVFFDNLLEELIKK